MGGSSHSPTAEQGHQGTLLLRGPRAAILPAKVTHSKRESRLLQKTCREAQGWPLQAQCRGSEAPDRRARAAAPRTRPCRDPEVSWKQEPRGLLKPRTRGQAKEQAWDTDSAVGPELWASCAVPASSLLFLQKAAARASTHLDHRMVYWADTHLTRIALNTEPGPPLFRRTAACHHHLV